MDENGLELTFALKHLDQHLQTNDTNVKKLLKLQQRIISKDNRKTFRLVKTSHSYLF